MPIYRTPITLGDRCPIFAKGDCYYTIDLCAITHPLFNFWYLSLLSFPRLFQEVKLPSGRKIGLSENREAIMASADNCFDWEKIRSALCFRRTKEEADKRKELFESMDNNGNGYLSLAELQKGIEVALQLPELLGSSPAVMRAFQVFFVTSNRWACFQELDF